MENLVFRAAGNPDREPHPDIGVAEAALCGDARAVDHVIGLLQSPALEAALVARGASAVETRDIIGDLIGDCFGGERARGGLHRLLSRYNGGCPLSAFFRLVAINRLISQKRRSKGEVSLDDESVAGLPAPGAGASGGGDEVLVSLLREAIARARERVDPEKLVFVRLMVGYGVPQKQLGSLLGWHESKISRAKSDLIAELRGRIMEELRRADPWLELEWEDFLELCSDSLDLFAS